MEDVLLPVGAIAFGIFLVLRRRELARQQMESRNRLSKAVRRSKRYGRRDVAGFVRANVLVGAWAIVLGLWMLVRGTDF